MIHLISRHPQFSCWHPFVDGIALAGLDLTLVWNREDGNAWLGPAYTIEAAKDAQMSPTKPSFFFFFHDKLFLLQLAQIDGKNAFSFVFKLLTKVQLIKTRNIRRSTVKYKGQKINAYHKFHVSLSL